jgi:hypothetical protein
MAPPYPLPRVLKGAKTFAIGPTRFLGQGPPFLLEGESQRPDKGIQTNGPGGVHAFFKGRSAPAAMRRWETAASVVSGEWVWSERGLVAFLTMQH